MRNTARNRNAAKQMFKAGWTVKEIAEFFGQQESTVYRWKEKDGWDDAMKRIQDFDGTLLEKNRSIYEWQINAMLKRIENAKEKEDFEFLLSNTDINSLVRHWEALTKGRLNFEMITLVANRLAEYVAENHPGFGMELSNVIDGFLKECLRNS